MGMRCASAARIWARSTPHACLRPRCSAAIPHAHAPYVSRITASIPASSVAHCSLAPARETIRKARIKPSPWSAIRVPTAMMAYSANARLPVPSGLTSRWLFR